MAWGTSVALEITAWVVSVLSLNVVKEMKN
jgi:hypothetical protein